MKIGLISLGCSKNQVDSEVMLGCLTEHGHEIVTDMEAAEAIIVNTCGFIESAKQESIDEILGAAQLKSEGSLKYLFVTGCLSQRYPEELCEGIPEVDGFLGVSEYGRLIEMLERAEKGEKPVFTGSGERFLKQKRVLTTPPFSAYVKIGDGCDNRCTYCAIPLIRGSYASRSYEDIMEECRALVSGGVTELTFISQDTSRYGSDFEGHPLLLKDLMHDASLIPGVKWVRVLYCYPDTVNEELLKEIKDNPKICKYLDLPLQHINGEMLKRMNRRGTPEDIKKLIARCREYGILVRTTMIVGFPGETEEQFEEMLSFVTETRFERLGAFTFSPEEGTAAAEMPDQIDEEEKLKRLDMLMMKQQEISYEINRSRVGSVVTALVERKEDSHWVCRSEKEAPEADGIIKVDGRTMLTAGEYINIRITGCDAYDLTGVRV